MEIVASAVCSDHVHLCVSITPKLSVSDFVGYLKGKSALMIYDKHPEMESKWDRSFWARGYYVTTIGNVNEETVKEYIQRQTEESKNEDKKPYTILRDGVFLMRSVFRMCCPGGIGTYAAKRSEATIKI